jgi:hypothetical protein
MIRRWLGGRSGALTTLLALVLASPLVAPQLLAFPHQTRSGDSVVWSETPIDQEALDRVIARAERLVAASPIANAEESRHIFLTQDSWRWVWLANTSRGAFALTRHLGHNVVVNRGDLAADRVVNDRKIGGSRRLSSVIAHEMTHGVLLRRFGIVATAMKPRWLVEGYCDYIAGESALTAAEVRQLEARREDHPALMYYHGRRRVAAMLSSNGGNVERLFAGAR